MTPEQQIERCLDLLRKVLGDELIAVYLYGSSIVGGLQRYSDIDLFAVSRRSTTTEQKRQLTTTLLDVSGTYRSPIKHPVELTIVVQSEVNPWRYPPCFDFQYGDWLRPEFTDGQVEPWATKLMPDLALLITQIRVASRGLVGPGPADTLPQVPYADVIAALADALDSLRADLASDTRNVLLTLARIWRTVETNAIGSKHSAASWAIARISIELRPVLQHAIDATTGKSEDSWDDDPAIAATADAMLEKIRTKLADPDRSNLAQTMVLAD